MAQMRIDVNASIGSNDVARDDGVAGATITITSLDGPGNFYIATSTHSPSPTVSGANPGTSWTFTAGPAGNAYLLRLQVGADINERDLIIPTAAGVTIPARQSHALTDTRDQNVDAFRIASSTFNKTSNAFGYAPLLEAALRLIGRTKRFITTTGTEATDVVISTTPPTAGQTLQASSATAAAWITIPPATGVLSNFVPNPNNILGTTEVLIGSQFLTAGTYNMRFVAGCLSASHAATVYCYKTAGDVLIDTFGGSPGLPTPQSDTLIVPSTESYYFTLKGSTASAVATCTGVYLA